MHKQIFKVRSTLLKLDGRTKIFRVGPILPEKMVRGTNFSSGNFGPRTIFSRTKIPVTEPLEMKTQGRRRHHIEPSLGLHLQDREYRCCLRYWLGVSLHSNSFPFHPFFTRTHGRTVTEILVLAPGPRTIFFRTKIPVTEP